MVSLGMKVASRNRRALPRPRVSPRLTLRPTVRDEIELWIEDRERLGRAKPREVDRAVVVMHVGETLPSDMRDWSYLKGVTQTRVKVQLPEGLVPGTRVCYAAWWESPSGKRGPASAPVCTRIGFDLAPRMAKRLPKRAA